MKFISSCRALALASLPALFLPAVLPTAVLAQTPKDAKPAKPSARGGFNPEVATLPNGLQIVVITNRRAPIVYHMLWIKAGSADEEQGKSGIAHFLEHMIFKGTQRLVPGAFDAVIERHGGLTNAATSHDYAHFFITTAAQYLDETLPPLAEPSLLAEPSPLTEPYLPLTEPDAR